MNKLLTQTDCNIDKVSEEKKELKVAVHDVNNLLNNVLSGIELLKENINANSKTNELLTFIKKNTSLAVNIIHELSVNNSSNNKEKSKIDLNLLISETLKLLKNNSLSNIGIAFNNPSGLYFIEGNYTEIKRVLLNLVVNAKEAISNVGNIKIHLAQTSINDSVFNVISISDNGSGIAKDILGKIFNEGYSNKNNPEKRGLGLFIVKNIMDDHSCKIQVRSSKKEGTTFELFFPEYDLEKKIRQLKNKKIIVVEDNPQQREVLKDLLISLKLNVFTASNGTEALELYANENPDLLFIDKNMPGMDGIVCSQRIRKQNSKLPIVLITGEPISNLADVKIVSKVLTKPYNFDRIQSTLIELL